jgi:hypothetical protein
MEGVVDQPLTVFSANRSYLRKIAIGLVLIVTGIFIGVIFNDAWFTEKNLWAFGVFGLGLCPFILWFYRGECWAFPVFELVGLFYGICFGLSSIFVSDDVSIVGVEERTQALKLTLFGLLGAYWAYYGIGRAFFKSLRPLRIKNPVSYDVLVKNAWIITWIYLFYRIFFINYGETIVFIHQPLMALGSLSNAIILVEVLTSRKNTLRKYILLSLVVSLQILIGLSSGALGQIALVMFFFLLIYLNVKKKLLVKTIVFFIIAIVFMNPVKHEMRSSIAENSNNLNFIEKADVFIELLENPGKYSDVHGSLENTISRIDHSGLLAEVMVQSPEYVPFAWGKTYVSLFTIWVPRFLWPEKPMSSVGNVWAHWYGLLGPNDFSSSYNLPWIVEFYVNFGVPGVLIGMFLCGLGFAWLKARLCSEQSSTLEYAIGVAILINLWFEESNFALSVGGILIYSVTLFFYFKILKLLYRNQNFSPLNI